MRIKVYNLSNDVKLIVGEEEEAVESLLSLMIVKLGAFRCCCCLLPVQPLPSSALRRRSEDTQLGQAAGGAHRPDQVETQHLCA